MKKLLLLAVSLFVFGVTNAQITMTTPSPEFGCPGLAHNVTVGVTNTSGISIPAGLTYSISFSVFDGSSNLIHFETQSFSDGAPNGTTKYITLTNVDFSSITTTTVCSVQIDLSYTFPSPGTYSTSGNYTVQFPPDLTITENPANTVDVTTNFGNYTVRYYLNGSYTSFQNEGTSGSFQPYNVGSYTAKAYDPISGCYSENPSNAINISVALSTKKAEEYAISVYPNPVTTHVYVRSANNKNLQFELSSAQGNLLQSHNFVEMAEISLGEFPTGIYYLSIIENNKVIGTYKLVK